MKYTFSNFLGSSPAAMEAKRQARRAAQVDTTVLLLGETGTGKEVLAQAIHSASPRAHGPFIGVNVAAIPDTLLEAEFFGASASAYTGADRRGRDGKFVLANGGTLFLDEVGDMPMGDAGEAAARAAGEGSRAARLQPRDQGGRARDRRLQRGPAPDGVDGPLPLRPLLPPLGAADRAAAAARPHRRPRGCSPTTSSRTSRAARAARSASSRPPRSPCCRAYAWPGNIRELRNVLEQVTLNSDSPRLSAEEFTLVLPRVAAAARAPATGPRSSSPTWWPMPSAAPSARRSPPPRARRSSPRSCSASRAPRSTRSSRSWRRAARPTPLSAWCPDRRTLVRIPGRRARTRARRESLRPALNA